MIFVKIWIHLRVFTGVSLKVLDYCKERRSMCDAILGHTEKQRTSWRTDAFSMFLYGFPLELDSSSFLSIFLNDDNIVSIDHTNQLRQKSQCKYNEMRGFDKVDQWKRFLRPLLTFVLTWMSYVVSFPLELSERSFFNTQRISFQDELPCSRRYCCLIRTSLVQRHLSKGVLCREFRVLVTHSMAIRKNDLSFSCVTCQLTSFGPGSSSSVWHWTWQANRLTCLLPSNRFHSRCRIDRRWTRKK